MFKRYFQGLKNEFQGYNVSRFGKDVMAGLTVCAVALPLALAFGVKSGADAAAGLITAILAGIIISMLSGASFQISGPTGAMMAVLIPAVSKFELQGVFLITLFAGAIVLLCGIFKLGKAIRFIPAPVVTGFTSGIAVTIALTQIDDFFGTVSVGESAIEKLLSYGELGFSPQWQAVLIGSLVIAIMILWPKKWNAKVPSSLVGIIVATAVSLICNFNIKTVGDIPQTLLHENRLSFSAINASAIPEMLPTAITVAALIMIESLLCGASAKRMCGGEFDPDQELIAQGIGNMIIPFFGGVPATAAIARTSVAIKSGCNTRLTGIIHALGLVASMFLLAPIMSKLPLAALAGVLLMTSWRMNEWHSIKTIFGKKYKAAILQFAVTLIATVVFDLTVAIILGVILGAFCFLVKSMKLDITAKTDDGVSYITVSGNIFYANNARFAEELEKHQGNVCIDLEGVSSIDISAAQELSEYVKDAIEKGYSVNVINPRPGVLATLDRTGVTELLAKDHCSNEQ